MSDKLFLSDFPSFMNNPSNMNIADTFNYKIFNGLSIPCYGDQIAISYITDVLTLFPLQSNVNGYFFSFNDSVFYHSFFNDFVASSVYYKDFSTLLDMRNRKFYVDNVGRYIVLIHPAGRSYGWSYPYETAYVFDTYEEACLFGASSLVSANFNLSVIIDFVLGVDTDEDGNSYFSYKPTFERLSSCVYPSCCYPDFAPIVKILGSIPSSNQLSNIKTIASLLGCDTSENGLSGCKLGSFYVERVVAMLGGSVYSDLLLTLKEACRVLGVDTNENGLKDCELSKEYVKRISTMLGA